MQHKSVMDAVLTAVLKPHHLASKPEKAQTYAMFYGRGAQREMKKVLQEPALAVCKAQLEATYLGAQFHCNGKPNAELQQRLHKANIAYRSLMGLWLDTKVKTGAKLRIFQAAVMPVLLSAQEVQCYTAAQIHKLESWRMKCVRRILQSQASVPATQADGSEVRHALSDNVIRKRWKIPTLCTELRFRRLKWLISLLRHPLEWVSLRATLCQQLPFEDFPQLDDHGLPTIHASPWLKQIVEDLAILHNVCPQVPKIEQLELGLREILATDSPLLRVKTRLKRLRSFDDTGNFPAGRAEAKDKTRIMQCEQCEFIANDLHALQSHRNKTHNILKLSTIRAVTNQCPYCEKSYATKQGAARHVHKRKAGQCPKAGGNKLAYLYPVIVPLEIECDICQSRFSSLHKYNLHVRDCDKTVDFYSRSDIHCSSSCQ